MRVAGRDEPVLVRCASVADGRKAASVVAREPPPLGQRQELPGKRANHLCDRGWFGDAHRGGGPVFIAHVRAGAPHGNQGVAADGIMDDAGDRLALYQDSAHHREERHTGSEVERPIEGIDGEREVGLRQPCDAARIGGTGLLGDHQRLGMALAQGLDDQRLGPHISLGDKVGTCTLLSHLVALEPAKPRHHLLRARLCQQVHEPLEVRITEPHRSTLADLRCPPS